MGNRVVVVVSTYNGERYLSEQLDSILRQSVPVDVFVRDDGSSDNTVQILASYSERYENFSFIAGDNLGCAHSFLTGLAMVPSSYDYYAFCDQDDIWHEDRIERALSILDAEQSDDSPLLYCSNLTFCTESMVQVSKSHFNKNGVDFPKLLFENECSGNTMIFNRVTRAFSLESGIDKVYGHDWWIALVASCFGKIIFDSSSTLEYRRLEGGNTSAAGSSGIALLRHRINTFIKRGHFRDIRQQLQLLLDAYGYKMDEHNKSLLVRCLNRSGLAKATVPCRLRQKMADEVVVRLLLLVNVL